MYDEPQLPKRRKLTKTFDDGLFHGDFPPDSKAHYKQCYYEALDLIIAAIHERFDQPRIKKCISFWKHF